MFASDGGVYIYSRQLFVRCVGLAQQLADVFWVAGKKLDIGKACIHFKSADDLELDVIGQIVAKVPPERCIEIGKAARRGAAGRRKTPGRRK